MFTLALSYGLMSMALYTASFSDKKLETMARMLVCGTVTCVGLSFAA